MTSTKLIEEIESAKAPSRFLDSKIAQALGWTSSYGGKDKDGKAELSWYPPGSTKPSKFPNYTSSLNDAYVLLSELDPAATVACTWGKESAQAQIEGEPPRVGLNPAMAICIAALHHQQKKKGE